MVTIILTIQETFPVDLMILRENHWKKVCQASAISHDHLEGKNIFLNKAHPTGQCQCCH
jgi:hypothetical protein